MNDLGVVQKISKIDEINVIWNIFILNMIKKYDSMI